MGMLFSLQAYRMKWFICDPFSQHFAEDKQNQCTIGQGITLQDVFLAAFYSKLSTIEIIFLFFCLSVSNAG